MDISEFEKRTSRLVSRGIVSKKTAVDMVNAFSQCEDSKKAESLEKIEKLNDEDTEFFIKLNLLINSIVY